MWKLQVFTILTVLSNVPPGGPKIGVTGMWLRPTLEVGHIHGKELLMHVPYPFAVILVSSELSAAPVM